MIICIRLSLALVCLFVAFQEAAAEPGGAITTIAGTGKPGSNGAAGVGAASAKG